MENVLHEPAIAYLPRYTLDEFLTIEWNDERYEFWEGELLTMSGGTMLHNEITGNIQEYFKNALKGSGCKSYQENIYLKIKTLDKAFLPDIMVSCNNEELISRNNFLEHPSILVEVLSDSTEFYDRTNKWKQYRLIPSLQYFCW
jgi:Uma2 family endonuclease